MTTTIRSQFNFLGLAPEIQYMICSQLCSHCCPETEQVNNNSWEQDEGQKTLLALCATSRRLRSMAQPMLYHRIPATKNIVSLVRTLHERPDLAASVKCYRQLSVDYYRSAFPSVTGWEDSKSIAYLKDVARSLQMERTDDRDFMEAEADKTFPTVFCNELLIAMLPSLETLSLLIDDGFEEPMSLRYLSNRFRKVDGPGLPNLRHLRFENEGGLFNMLTPAIHVMLRAAPNLQQVIFCSTEGPVSDSVAQHGDPQMLPELPFLRHLEFQSSELADDGITNRFMEHMLKNSPRLEHFRFHAGEHCFQSTPLPASKILRMLQSQNTLKSLEINYSDWFEGGSWPSPDFLVGSVNRFSNLQTLKLDEASFCHHRSGDLNHPWNCLTECVPQTVSTLEVKIIEGSLVWGDLAELAAQAAKFPQLRQVNISAINGAAGPWSKEVREKGERIMKAFAKSRISSQVTTQPHSSSQQEDAVLGMI